MMPIDFRKRTRRLLILEIASTVSLGCISRFETNGAAGSVGSGGATTGDATASGSDGTATAPRTAGDGATGLDLPDLTGGLPDLDTTGDGNDAATDATTGGPEPCVDGDVRCTSGSLPFRVRCEGGEWQASDGYGDCDGWCASQNLGVAVGCADGVCMCSAQPCGPATIESLFCEAYGGDGFWACHNGQWLPGSCSTECAQQQGVTGSCWWKAASAALCKQGDFSTGSNYFETCCCGG
jgi:hypothetical protein